MGNKKAPRSQHGWTEFIATLKTVEEGGENAMSEKEPIRVIIRINQAYAELENIKKLVKAIEDMQKECSCHCTLSVDVSWLNIG